MKTKETYGDKSKGQREREATNDTVERVRGLAVVAARLLFFAYKKPSRAATYRFALAANYTNDFGASAVCRC